MSSPLKQTQQLLKVVVTTEDLARVQTQVKSAQASLFGKKSNSHAALQALPIELQPPADATNELESWLAEILSLLNTVPKVALTLAYLPSAKETAELASMLRQKLSPHLVIQIKRDPDLLAGIRVELNDRRYEYSLAHTLKEFYVNAQ